MNWHQLDSANGFKRTKGDTMRYLRRKLFSAAMVALLMTWAAPALADQPEDAWITTKVKMALLTDETVGTFDINVDTFDGRVTLHGQTATDTEKAVAEKRAMEVRGVREVRNLLAVVPGEARDTIEAADDELQEQLETVLERDDALKESDIAVKSVNDGIVVLSGEATTLSAHRRALEDARSVDGVRRVESEILSPDELGDEEVWYDDEATTTSERAERAVSDAWITTKAKMFLMGEPGLSPLAINVDTDGGVVTLFGIVGTDDVKRRAGAEVGKVDGVKSVENELQVVPDVAANRVEAADDEVLAAVQKRLKDHQSLSDASIDVEVKNRAVRLTGTVASQRDRVTALSTASATEGVDSVIDDLALERPRS